MGQTHWSTSQRNNKVSRGNVFIGTEDTPLSFNLPRHGECLGSFSIVGHADDSCFPPGCGAPDVPRRSLPDHTTFEGRHLGVAAKRNSIHTPSNRFFSIYIHRYRLFFLSLFSITEIFLPSFLPFFSSSPKKENEKRLHIYVYTCTEKIFRFKEWILPGSCSRNLPFDGSLKRRNGFLIVVGSARWKM